MAIETRAVATNKPVELPGPGFLAGMRDKIRKPAQERILFTERLALLLETGTSLHGALKILKEQTAEPAMAKLLGAMQSDLLEGKSFSEALRKHPQLFPATYVNLVAASESAGFMHEVLTQLVDIDEKQERLRATLSSALMYPAFLIVFSLAVVVFVLMVVFPKFALLFASIRNQLPVSTLILMALSDFLGHYWLAVVGALGAGGAGMLQWMRLPRSRTFIDGLKLRLPGVKEIFVRIYLVRTMRVMAISLKNGVSLVDTLAACREVVDNREFQAVISRVESEVTQGKGISKGFNEAEMIPAMVRQMIATGEETGNLSIVMGRIADFYERELSKKVTTLSKLAEPVMLLIMGAVVGIIVSSLILPIFKLSRAVH
jgi:type II secretory pathway component PulF